MGARAFRCIHPANGGWTPVHQVLPSGLRRPIARDSYPVRRRPKLIPGLGKLGGAATQNAYLSAINTIPLIRREDTRGY